MGSAPKYKAIFVNLLGTVNFFHLRFTYVNMVTEKQKCRNIFNSFIYLVIYLFIHSFSDFSKALALTIRTGSLQMGIMRRIRGLSSFSLSLCPSGKYPVRMWWQVEKPGINQQAQGFSLQLKNGWLEVLELVTLFLLKMGTFVAKNWKEISVDAIMFCFVKICFERKGTNTKSVWWIEVIWFHKSGHNKVVLVVLTVFAQGFCLLKFLSFE